MFDYSLPAEITKQVFSVLSNWENLRRQADEASTDFDYSYYTAVQYDRIHTSRTNSISRPTERLALEHIEARQRQLEARRTMEAIERGIMRAAKTSPHIANINSINADLTYSLIYRYARDDLGIDPRTLAKYRKRAIYFIAEELGFLGNKPKMEPQNFGRDKVVERRKRP